jgi:hypothetical protein
VSRKKFAYEDDGDNGKDGKSLALLGSLVCLLNICILSLEVKKLGQLNMLVERHYVIIISFRTAL